MSISINSPNATHIVSKNNSFFLKTFAILLILLFLSGFLSSFTICFGNDGHVRFEIIRLSHFIPNVPFSCKDSHRPAHSYENDSHEYCNDIPILTRSTDIFHSIENKPYPKFFSDSPSLKYLSRIQKLENQHYFKMSSIFVPPQSFYYTDSLIVLII